MSSFSLISPFYPTEAKKKNVGVTWVGLVLGIMPIVKIFSSTITGFFLKKIGGRIYVFMCGSMFIVIYIAIHGYLDDVNNHTEFIFLSLLGRILGGLGSGANITVCMAISLTFYP